MRPLSLASLTLVLLIAGEASVGATEIFPLDELEPGLRGIAYTVFRGDSISAFHVEVIDRMPGRGAFELVLVRGEPELMERGGVSQGMSGSPVYIDGRLLGAMAYNFSYAREPMALVTPIGAMFALAERNDARRASAGSIDHLPFLLEGALPAGGGALPRGYVAEAVAGAPLPLSVGGLDPGTLAGLERRFSDQGFRFFPLGAPSAWAGAEGKAEQAGGAGATEAANVAPGAAVAAELLRGPVSAAATGTLTHVEGDRFWAFGHPFLDEGAIDLPIAAANVHGVMSSLVNSFKIASVGSPIGRILHDGRAGIYGKLGDAPPMLPLRINLNDGYGVKHNAEFEAARHPRLLGSMLRLALQGWLNGPLALQDKGGIAVSLTLYPAEREPLSLEQRFAGEGVLQQPALWAQAIVDALQRNPAGPIPLDSLRVDLEWSEGEEAIQLVDLGVVRPTIARGESWQLSARFRQGGSEFSRSFAVPALAEAGRALPPGGYQLHFSDSGSYQQWDARRQPRLYRFTDHAALLDLLDRLEAGGKWLLWVSAEGERTVLGGREVDLPVWFRELQPEGPKINQDDKPGRHIVGTTFRIDAASETRGYASIPVAILPTPARNEP